MATVIDSLVVELDLDPSKMTSGQRDALAELRRFETEAKRSGDAVEGQSKRLLDFFTAFKREALVGLGVFFGGAEAFNAINYISNLDATTGRLAKTMDLSAQQLSAWQGAMMQVGGSADSANSALSGLSSEMSRFVITGQSAMLPILTRLGISLFDQNHRLKTSSELFMEIGDAIQNWDPRQATAFLQMIPGMNQHMINFLLLSHQTREEYLAIAAQTAPSDADIRNALEFTRDLGLMERAATNLGRALLDLVGPGLTMMMNGMARIMTFFGSGKTDEQGTHWFTPWQMMMGAITGNIPAPTGTPAGAPGGASSGNWSNFLSGLSYLETSQQNVGNASSSAQGFFQFLSGTREKAMAAGLPDPWAGGYADQANAAMAYIQRFYPQAAAAIERGDFQTAIMILKGEWPSLPGGSQPQSLSRYSTFRSELTGGGRRPAAWAPGAAPAGTGGPTTYSSSLSIGNLNVNLPGVTDAQGFARDIRPALQTQLDAGALNTGPQ